MPRGYITCPICQGKGTITEDAREYEFVTRDPKTDTCLICAGKGLLPVSAKLPDGTPASRLGKPQARLTRATDKRRRATSEPAPAHEPITPPTIPRRPPSPLRWISAASPPPTTPTRHHAGTPGTSALYPHHRTSTPRYHIYALLRILNAPAAPGQPRTKRPTSRA